jgi:hypothetical protein
MDRIDRVGITRAEVDTAKRMGIIYGSVGATVVWLAICALTLYF